MSEADTVRGDVRLDQFELKLLAVQQEEDYDRTLAEVRRQIARTKKAVESGRPVPSFRAPCPAPTGWWPVRRDRVSRSLCAALVRLWPRVDRLDPGLRRNAGVAVWWLLAVLAVVLAAVWVAVVGALRAVWRWRAEARARRRAARQGWSAQWHWDASSGLWVANVEPERAKWSPSGRLIVAVVVFSLVAYVLVMAAVVSHGADRVADERVRELVADGDLVP